MDNKVYFIPNEKICRLHFSPIDNQRSMHMETKNKKNMA